MLFDSIKMVDGSEVSNLAVSSGTVLPIGQIGELFYKSDLDQLFVNNGASWVPQLSASSDLTLLLPAVISAGTYSLVNVNSKGLVVGGSKPTTLAGYGITDAQSLDGDLTSIAALSGSFGTLKKIAVNTWTLDTNSYLSANQNISISGDGVGSGSTSITLTLSASGVSAGTYGSNSSIPSFTVDSKGRISSASNNSPSIDTSAIVSGTFNNSRISSNNVTQHQAALSINESQIADANVLTRVAGNETVTGSWTFSSPVTGASPVSGSHLTTKDYVDNIAAGVSPHLAVLTSTTANIALSGIQTLDGVIAGSGTRVLVKDQTNAAENGVYVVSSGAWARATDFDGSPTNEVAAGDLVYVETGTLNGNSSWILVTYGTIVLGTSPLAFSVFSRPGELVAGAGLTKSGNTFSVGTASSSRITVDVDTIDLAATGVSAGLYSNVTVDIYGRVISASSTQPWSTIVNTPTTLTGYGITDAQPLNTLLTSVTGLSSNGLIVKIASGASASRSVAVTGVGLSITNPDGVNGNIIIDSNATSVNTASTIVSRDTSGNFSAGTITASLIGNASTANALATSRTITLAADISGSASFNGSANATINATLATVNSNVGTFGSATLIPIVTVNAKGLVTGISTSTVSASSSAASNVTNDVLPSTAVYPVWVSDISGDQTLNVSNSKLSFIPSTGILSAIGFAGTLQTAAQPNITSLGTLGSLAVTGAITGTSFNSITGLSSTTPLNNGTAAVGTSTTAARADHVHQIQTTISGNAATATTLQTARTINGVSFNGSADIIINAIDSTSRVASSLLGALNGVATLDNTGKVPTTQLPSYVDDVIEAANLAAFPATGESGKIYVALDTNKTYRWSGSSYVYITSGAVDSVAGKTGVVTLVKADVGLGNVDNISDVNKPVSTAQASAINGAQAAAIAASAPLAHVGSNGAAHAVVTTAINGFMSAADKIKLDAVSGSNTGDETAATIKTKLGITLWIISSTSFGALMILFAKKSKI